MRACFSVFNQIGNIYRLVENEHTKTHSFYVLVGGATLNGTVHAIHDQDCVTDTSRF